jgi:multiple sugar transport system ATP-binding protein
VADGEFLILLGPSGCGKSTALRMVAGLDQPTSGSILIDGSDVTSVEPQDRNVAMVFQSYALYPHKSVRQNIEFPLRNRRVERSERARRADEAAQLLGLFELMDRRPGQLSGGQRQRVALARAIVRDASVFLMDEPLSNLDALTRVHTRAELTELHQRLGVTIIYVTHDQVEAMTMGTRIAVMDQGKLQQVGTPEEIYGQPANRFVAGFIGSPPMNLLAATVNPSTSGSPTVWIGTASVGTAPHNTSAGPVVCGIRPEHLHRGEGPLTAQVVAIESLGHERHLHCAVPTVSGPATVILREPMTIAAPAISSEVHLGVSEIHLFDPTTGIRL